MGRVARAQAISGLVFALFLTLHLTTTVSAVGGPASYDGVLGAVRRLYRPHIAVELALIGIPALVHIVCAVLQIIDRRRRRRSGEALPTPSWRVRIHRWAGYFLLAAIGGHVFATRVMPAGADFAYLAYSILGWPAAINPYYVILGTAGAVHLVLGLGFAAAILAPRRFASPAVARLFAWGAAAGATAVIAGVAFMIARAPQADRSRFPEYRAAYEKHLPFMVPMHDLEGSR